MLYQWQWLCNLCMQLEVNLWVAIVSKIWTGIFSEQWSDYLVWDPISNSGQKHILGKYISCSCREWPFPKYSATLIICALRISLAKVTLRVHFKLVWISFLLVLSVFSRTYGFFFFICSVLWQVCGKDTAELAAVSGEIRLAVEGRVYLLLTRR